MLDSEPTRERRRDLEEQLAGSRRAMEALRQSEERFRLLVERARDIVYRFSVERGEFEYISPVVLATTGYEPSAFYDAPGLALELVHPDDRPLLDAYWQEGDFGRPLAVRCRHRDGDTLWVEHRSLPTYDEGGRLLAVEGIVRDVSDNVRLLEAAEEHNERLGREVSGRRRAESMLRRFSARIVNYQEEERRQVARELHDGVSQWLCGVGFSLETVVDQLPPGSEALSTLAKTKDLVDRCIDEIRRISQRLRPGVLDDIGLIPAIRSMLDEFEARTGVAVSAQLPERRRNMPAELDITVYRLLQESVAAVEAKHGLAAVELVLAFDDDQLSVSLADDGDAYVNGNGPQWGPQIILESLRERAGFVGGSVTTGHTADGSRLDMHFPVPSEGLPDE